MDDFANTPVSALLTLASSQLEVAAHTTDAQVETLASAIGALVVLGAQLEAESAAGTAQDALARKIVEQAQCALMAMQFHDQIVQRVAHVRDALSELNQTLRGAPAGEVDWARVLAGIRSRYSMEDEHRMFDRIIGAAANARDATHDSPRGSVDLF